MLKVWSLEHKKFVGQMLADPSALNPVAVTAAGDLLLAGGVEGTVVLFSLSNGDKLADLARPHRPDYGPCCHPRRAAGGFSRR